MPGTVLDANDPGDFSSCECGDASSQDSDSREATGVLGTLVEFGGLQDTQVQILPINWNQFQNLWSQTVGQGHGPACSSKPHAHLARNTIPCAVFDDKE